MKRLFQIIVCFALLIALAGCKGSMESPYSSTGNIKTEPSLNGIIADPDSSETPGDPDTSGDSEVPKPQDPVKDDPSPNLNEAPGVSDTPDTDKKSEDEDKKDPVTTPPDTPVQTPDTNTKPESTPSCTHATTGIANKADATCTKAGYTGDTICTACQKILTQGSTIAATGHKNTEVRNQKDASTSAPGYTGDTYCKDCDTKISTGSTIPQLQEKPSGSPYELPDGTIIYINEAADIRKHTMKQATKSVSHPYSSVEKEILRLVNVERNKAGLASLSWYEDAYCFTKTRATECLTKFSHTRPDGSAWTTVYTNSGVLLYGTCGENLHLAQGYSIEEIAAQTVSDWMNSPGHKANILNASYKQIAIAVVKDGDRISSVQNFFG